jgi:ABC-type sulfate transport system permease subunit
VLGRLVVGAALGAGLGAAWWGLRELIASGAVCSTDDWDCLALGLIAMPVSLVVGVLLAWIVLKAARQGRPLGYAAVGVTFTAVLTLLTVWVSVPAGSVAAGVIGFVLAAPVTARG